MNIEIKTMFLFSQHLVSDIQTDMGQDIVNTEKVEDRNSYLGTNGVNSPNSNGLRDRKVTKNATHSNDTRQITLEELAQHTKAPSLWITMDNKVFDVTKWVKHHPGGEAAITNVAGRDVSDLVRQFHRPEVWQKKINHWYIGDLVLPPTKSPVATPSESITKEFRELNTWLEDHGWFVSNKFYYLQKMTILLSMLALSWVFFLHGISNGPTAAPNYTFYLSAFMVGLFWQQANFVGHDIGHSSVFQTRR